MMLVVDITKGMQTQTAECLVIGEITCDKMIVVLNKIDMVPVDKRASTIERVFRFISVECSNFPMSRCARTLTLSFLGFTVISHSLNSEPLKR